jgi:hypothetical protein
MEVSAASLKKSRSMVEERAPNHKCLRLREDSADSSAMVFFSTS